MKQKYEQQLAFLQERFVKAEKRQCESNDPQHLKAAIQSEVAAILEGERSSEVFSKMLISSLTVFRDRHMDLRLNYLPQVFRFAE